MLPMTCFWCKGDFNIPKKEHTRQTKRGREHFFCSLNCAAFYANSKKGNLRKKIKKVCPHCGHSFDTMSGSKEATFCSRSCASAGSVTEKRREAGRNFYKNKCPHSLQQMAKSLRSREWRKYKHTDEVLNKINIKHLFEYAIEEIGIFDLAIFEQKILIEFDGEYHNNLKQQVLDQTKDALAIADGWNVIRVPEELPQQMTKTVLKIVL